MIREVEAEDDDETPAPKGDAREKLKHVAHYAMLGFAPVVAVAALGVALFTGGNGSELAQLDELNARIESLSASSLAAKEELENLKFGMSREKSQRADERRNAEERDAKIVQSVTRLQEKMKIVPTLEEQLRAADRAHAAHPVAAAVSAPSAASAPAVVEKTQPASAPVSASAVQKPATAIPAPKVEEKKKSEPAPAKKADEKKKVVPAPKAEEKMSPQVKALKKAIEQYNKE
ncbi:MAG: hypothetical protein WAW02_16030 [Sideroxyarcus sp.]